MQGLREAGPELAGSVRLGSTPQAERASVKDAPDRSGRRAGSAGAKSDAGAAKGDATVPQTPRAPHPPVRAQSGEGASHANGEGSEREELEVVYVIDKDNVHAVPVKTGVSDETTW